MNRLPRPLAVSLAVISAVAMFAAAISNANSAESRPLRVLYLDPGGAEQTQPGPLADAMRDLGRDAIWFDYLPGVEKPDPEFAKNFDLVLKHGDVLTRGSCLAALSPERRAGWEKFLAQREPEKREKNPNVANYEKRPEPIAFQHPFSVKGSMERTQVPADCRLELFAGEPDIAKPIAFAWDERGRLWVAETRDYPHGVVESGEGTDDIKICEDTDGDGRADKFTVFADRLNIPTGIVFARGGVIVSQPPRFVFLKDTNGDDKADVREVVLDAWGIRDTHAQASNLHYGYDNWIHGCVGYSGFKGIVGGKTLEFSMGTYRFRPDGSVLEFLHQFTNNAWAQSFNAAGDEFGGTANGAPFFFGGIPATAYPPGTRMMTAKKINAVDMVHAITPNFRQVDVFGGYTAAAGSAFIESANLPPRLQGKAMICEPTMKVITLMGVQRDGSGYVAKDGFNLVASADEWMSPVFAEVGPDGAVWFADWQNFIIQHNPTPSVERGGYQAETGPGGAHVNDLRDHARGRIYRVVWNDAKPVKKSLAGADAARLVAALDDDTQYWRLTAQRLLVEGKHVEAEAQLRERVLAGASGARPGPGAIHALWALDGLGALDEQTHKAALFAKDAALRRNAIRALRNDAVAAALFFGAGVISDPDPTTRLAALVKLGDFPTTPEIQTAARALASDAAVRADEWLAAASRLLARKHGVEVRKEGPNLLPNPGLETLAADGLPEGWKRRDYGNKPGNATAEWKVVAGPLQRHSGAKAFRVITRDEADTSFFAEVSVKPNTEYRLSGWVKVHALRGKASLNDHIGRAETDKLARDSDWTEIDATFNSGKNARASINLLHVGKGDSYFDDVKLCELLPADDESAKVAAGDPKRGQDIFWNHPVAACKNCHMLGGIGSTVGPALDGIAARKDATYIMESLMEPNKVLAQGFEKLGISPMPPMNLILKPQEIADVQAFLQTLKQPVK